jgi:hypothetical protein
MNCLSYYNRQKDEWTNEEIDQLREEYQNKKLTISQIGDIHHRTPGSVSCRLKKEMLISHNTLARGYNEYKNSNLYKEIVTTGDKNRVERKKNKEEFPTNKIQTSISLHSKEYMELKKEVSSLHEKIDEILRLINAVYTFETSEE